MNAIQTGERDRQEQERREREKEPDRGGRPEGQNESERNRDSGGRGVGRSTGLGDGGPGGLRLESGVIANLEKRSRRLEIESEDVASLNLSPGFFHNSKDLVVNNGVFNDVQGNQMNTNSGA